MEENKLITRPGIPDVITLILSSTLAESTKQKYVSVIRGYIDAGGQLDASAPPDVAALASYAAGLSKSRQAQLKAALKLWSKNLATHFKSQAMPQDVAAIQASLWRLEAMCESIQVEPAKGRKLALWLSQAEVKRLLATCDDSLRGRRDKIILGLLTGAGLRRSELAALRFEDISMRPIRERFRTVLQVKGKGAKDRTIPISDRLAAGLDAWGAEIGPAGRVARAVDPRGEVRWAISDVAIFDIVSRAGAVIGKGELAPHDLRRTYAQLGYEAGVPIVQISVLLGHANLATTQRYLDLDLDLESTVSDFIPFE
jgi:integrase